MSDVNDLEKRVQQLEPDQLAEFRDWFVAFDHRQWDDEIAADLEAGKLDELIREAVGERAAGQVREL